MGFGIYTSEKRNNGGFFPEMPLEYYLPKPKGEKVEEKIRILFISFVNRWI